MGGVGGGEIFLKASLRQSGRVFDPAIYGTPEQSAEKRASRNRKHTSAAEAACKQSTFGTAEAVPLSKTGFFRSL
jgi:hypothetical protein